MVAIAAGEFVHGQAPGVGDGPGFVAVRQDGAGVDAAFGADEARRRGGGELVFCDVGGVDFPGGLAVGV